MVHKLACVLKEVDLIPSHFDLYIFISTKCKTLIGVYVDVILIVEKMSDLEVLIAAL